jgi:hypothetical protein
MKARLLTAAVIVTLAACSSGASSVEPSDAPGKAGDGAQPTPNEGDERGPDGGTEPGDGGDSDVEADSGPDGGPIGDPNALLPATMACAPSADVCNAPAYGTPLVANFRKDYWMPEYDEQGAEPRDGGRFQIAGIAAATGDVTAIRIDGELVENLLVEPKLEWYHVWPRKVVAGAPVWVAFHSTDPKWNSATRGAVEVETTGGTALRGAFALTQPTVPLTYVTTTLDRTAFVLHLQNREKVARTVRKVVVNGRDVTAAACIGTPVLAPGDAAMITVPNCGEIPLGSAWTAVVEFDAGPVSVGVGRVVPPFFPMETWPTGSECTFPTGNDANFRRHLAAGIDTFYMYWGGNGSCSYNARAVVNEIAPQRGDLKLLIGDDFLAYPNPEQAITNTSAVAGFLTGDESDKKVYDNGKPVPETKAKDARRLWDMYPTLPVYNGGMTNKKVGAFAGMTDIQGMDYYVAACAPHVTSILQPMKLRGAHDYLKNTRNNHMPLPTWLYAQGLFPGWNKNAPAGLNRVQPAPQEILVQAMSVVTAGGKGFMWFQSNLNEADASPPRWKAMSDITWTLRGVRELLREGDITGMAQSTGEAIVDAIRSRDAIVVPVINLATSAAPTEAACGLTLVGTAAPQWVLRNQSLNVSVRVPSDFQVSDVFEVHEGNVVAPSAGKVTVAANRTLRLEAVPVSNANPVRLFVLARSKAVREDVASRLRR